MTVTTANARHILVRLSDNTRLPDAIVGTLRDEVILAGHLRASGVLADVELRVFGGGTTRKIAGPVHAVTLEGSIGLTQGDVTCGLRAVLTRETETGIETVAGEIVSARVLGLEVFFTAYDDVTAVRGLDASGVVLFDPQSVAAPTASSPVLPPAATAPAAPAPAAPAPVAPAPAPVAPAAPPPPAAPTATWADAAKASEPEPPKPAPPPPPPAPAAPRPSPTFTATALPARPAKPPVDFDDQIYPEAGDVCEHFAFGRCEVVKSDGDRLHVRLGKDGRIKEIALEMLKITPLPPVEGATGRHFKLDRKL